MTKDKKQTPIIKSSPTADEVTSTWAKVAQATTPQQLHRALQAHREALGVHLVVISALLGSMERSSDPVPHPTPAPWDN